MANKEKPYVIGRMNPERLCFAESKKEAFEFAKRYFKNNNVFAEDVDSYKASFVLSLEGAFICGVCNKSYETCSCIKDARR